MHTGTTLAQIIKVSFLALLQNRLKRLLRAVFLRGGLLRLWADHQNRRLDRAYKRELIREGHTVSAAQTSRPFAMTGLLFLSWADKP